MSDRDTRSRGREDLEEAELPGLDGFWVTMTSAGRNDNIETSRGRGIPGGGNGGNAALGADMFRTHQRRENKGVGWDPRLGVCLLCLPAGDNCSPALEASGMKAFPFTEGVLRSPAGSLPAAPGGQSGHLHTPAPSPT